MMAAKKAIKKRSMAWAFNEWMRLYMENSELFKVDELMTYGKLRT